MEQIMGLARGIYPIFNMNCGTQPFSLSDAYLTLFLHDLEKPWKYAGTPEEKKRFESDTPEEAHKAVKKFMLEKVNEYGIDLTPEHMNALKYVHGE